MTFLIIAFSPKSNRLFPGIFCRRFKHCVVIDLNSNVLIQVGADKTRIICIDSAVLGRLKSAGWVLVRVGVRQARTRRFCVLNCVGFAKSALGISAPWVLTPLGLFNYLKTHHGVLY